MSSAAILSFMARILSMMSLTDVYSLLLEFSLWVSKVLQMSSCLQKMKVFSLSNPSKFYFLVKTVHFRILNYQKKWKSSKKQKWECQLLLAEQGQSERSIPTFEFTTGFGCFPPKKILSVATSFGRAKDYDLSKEPKPLFKLWRSIQQ